MFYKMPDYEILSHYKSQKSQPKMIQSIIKSLGTWQDAKDDNEELFLAPHQWKHSVSFIPMSIRHISLYDSMKLDTLKFPTLFLLRIAFVT